MPALLLCHSHRVAMGIQGLIFRFHCHASERWHPVFDFKISEVEMFSDYHKIDLTHTLNSNVFDWDGKCGFEQHMVKDYPQLCRVHKLAMSAGVGTHIDAPSHFIPNALNIDQLALEKLLVPARVIDVSNVADENYLISPEDILAHEKQYGVIPEHHLVIFYTGWSRHWFHPEKYRNQDKHGVLHFPALSADAAETLIERNITGIAIDTLSPDCKDVKFPVHHLLLGADKYIIENIANAERLPPVGAEIIILPLKLEDGTEAPIRIVGLVRK